nr:basic leucine zipper 4-like [Tanacetum cinerariifolium]
MLSEFFTDGENLDYCGVEFFETDGFTPWDTKENTFLFSHNDQEPVISISGSDNSTPKSNTSDEVKVVDERKRRRMISNRESARRSRMRKQKHVENLGNLLSRLMTGTRDLTNRLRLVYMHGKLVREENRRLDVESMLLQQRLWDIRQVLLVRQFQHQLVPSSWPCNNNVTYSYEQNPPSLIK